MFPKLLDKDKFFIIIYLKLEHTSLFLFFFALKNIEFFKTGISLDENFIRTENKNCEIMRNKGIFNWE